MARSNEGRAGPGRRPPRHNSRTHALPRRVTHRTALLATTLAVALVALLLVPPTLVSAHHTTVTGVPTCLSDGTYSVSWSALNSESDKEIVTLTATLSLSEQDIGTVAMSPIPVPFNGTATGTSTHPGTTPGTLTLTVDAEWDNGVTNSSFGSVTLAGTCTPDTGKIVVQKVIVDGQSVSRGGSGWVFDVSYYEGNGTPPPGATLTTDSSGMAMDEFMSGLWTVSERSRQGFQNLGGFAIYSGSLVEVDPFDLCTGRILNGSSEESTANLSSSASAITLLDQDVIVELGRGQTVVVCWFNDPDQPPPPTPTINLTIVKQVTADAGAVAPDAGTLFDFELDCIGTDVNFSLADGESRTVTFTGATQCSLTETNDNGADSVTGEFSNELISSNRTVTVVNNYEGVVVLGTAITKVLTTADPAAVGERVSFDVTVTFEGTILPDAEFVDVYENEFLSFESATSGFAPVACDRFASTPDAAHDTVVCPAGDLTSGSATMTLHFTALKGTLGDRTLDEAKVVSDLDGPGGDPPLMIGPAFDDVEIVEVLALPPLGDGSLSGQGGAPLALVVALAALAVASAAMARRLVREGARA